MNRTKIDFRRLKRFRPLLPGLLLLLVTALPFSGCREGGSPAAVQNGSGTLEINLLLEDREGTDRTLTDGDSTAAAANSDLYEVLIYNAETVNTTLLTAAELESGPITLTVEAGSYSVLVLAGVDGGAEGVLLGSGNCEGITVAAETVTPVTVSLTSVSHSLTLPETVDCSTTYTVMVTGNTNNPLLMPVYGGTTQDRKPYIEIGEDSTNQELVCSGDSCWSGSLELTAPPLANTKEVRFYGGRIKIVDPAFSIDEELDGFGSLNWFWLNANDAPESLEIEVKREIDFAASGTGVGITIGWS